MEDKQDEQQPNLPTIREIESQIWKIARTSAASPTQLEACCLLLARIEASENAGKAWDGTVELVKTGEPESAEKDTGGGLNVDPERKHER